MRLLGDVNGDGRITSFDVSLIQFASLELITLLEDDFKSADINQDGKLSIADLAKVRKHCMGISIINEVIE